MYKDKDGIEHESFKDIDAYGDSIICPCCGDIQNPDIELDVLQCPPVELECLVCGCVFEADFEVVFSTVCKKYRTDGKEK